MATVLLGNPAPLNAPHLNQSTTRVEFWDGIDDAETVDKALVRTATSNQNDRHLLQRAALLADEHKKYALAIHELEDLWPQHAAGGQRPSYVVSDDKELQKAVANYFGCPEGEPQMLLTNGGRDALHAQHLGTSAQPAQFNFLAISANVGSGFAATDTTLAGELTTLGLARASATYAHTTGQNTSTLTHTWTYSGSTSQVIASTATFNAVSAGTLGEEDALSSSVTVATSGDTCTVTFTLTAG